MSDTELEAAVAEKVAGWKTERMSGYHAAYCSVDPFSVRGKVAYGSPHEAQADYPRYLTDAKAVIALLDQWQRVAASKHPEGRIYWQAGSWRRRRSKLKWVELCGMIGGTILTEADTFCRAGCLALLDAHDCGKEGV